MTRRRGHPFGAAAIATLVAGCIPHHDVALRGGVDWVAVSYAGDIAETLPAARRYCAQFERQPVLGKVNDDNVVYACIKANPGP